LPGYGLKKLSRDLVLCEKALAKGVNDKGTNEPTRLKGHNMAEVETTIDSIRCTTARPERIIVLKQKGAENYLPIWVSSSQADILAAQIQGQPSTAPDLFLANINAADSNIRSVIIHLENDTFYAQLQLHQQDKLNEAKCPIGIALTLAFRAGPPILVDEMLFDKAGLKLPPEPMSIAVKQPWWRRLLK